jgi:CheY-like chemotaxis protein
MLCVSWSGTDAKTVPVIAISGNVGEEDQAASKAAGMCGHLAKPIETEANCTGCCKKLWRRNKLLDKKMAGTKVPSF